MVSNEADGISEATQIREAFNRTEEEVRNTYEIEKCHEEQQNAIDLFSDGKDVFISLHALALPTVHCFHCLYCITANFKVVTGLHDSCRTKMCIFCLFAVLCSVTGPFLSLHSCS